MARHHQALDVRTGGARGGPVRSAVPLDKGQARHRRTGPLDHRHRARHQPRAVRRHRALHRRRRWSGGRRLARVEVAPAIVPVERLPLWATTLLAMVSLVFVLGIAGGVMVGAGHLIHVLEPAKRFDVFYLLHESLVEWSLAAACVLWLLPPHRWATRLIERPARGAPEATRGSGAEEVSR